MFQKIQGFHYIIMSFSETIYFSNKMSFDSFNFYEDSEPRTKKKIRKNYNDDDEDSWNDDYNYFSRMKTTMRTRTKNLSKREIYLEQIGEDQLFNQCVQHARLLEYLELNNYYDIYDYVKYCNKKGVLLEIPIKQYFGESINTPNYNYYQQIEIHQRNFVQRQIEGLADEVKKLKITKDPEPHSDSKNILIRFYDLEAVKEEQRRIKNQNEEQKKKSQTLRRNLRDLDKKIKYQNNNDKTIQLKQYYEESQLDVPINEQIIKNCIVEFLQLNCEIVQNFQPTAIQKNNTIIDEIDYDSLSEDSLEEICSIHPKDRKNFQTLFFVNRVQVIKVVPIINMQKDSSLIE